jgi:hypothetical protein
MSLLEIAPAARALPRAEKLQLVRLLVDDLARDEAEESLLEAGASYPVWTPLEAYDAARILQEALEAKKSRKGRGKSKT